MQKKFIIACVMLSAWIGFNTAKSDAQNWLMAKSAWGTNDDVNAASRSTDAKGNVYTTGYFYGPAITFGKTTLTNTTNGFADIVIVKYDADGNVIWAKSAGGTGDDNGYSICTDADGNIYVTGSFYSPSITFGNTTLTNAGSDDVFMVKYDPSGNVLWAKSAGGTGDDNGYSVSADADGNVSLTGYSYSPSITFNNTTLTSSGNAIMFLVKQDASGNVLSAETLSYSNMKFK